MKELLFKKMNEKAKRAAPEVTFLRLGGQMAGARQGNAGRPGARKPEDRAC
jgi:hypothetical protein